MYELPSKASEYIPEGSKINNVRLIDRFGCKFVRVGYTVPESYATEHDMTAQNRFVDILLIRSPEYKGLEVMSFKA
jgi:hypothetical protein